MVGRFDPLISGHSTAHFQSVMKHPVSSDLLNRNVRKSRIYSNISLNSFTGIGSNSQDFGCNERIAFLTSCAVTAMKFSMAGIPWCISGMNCGKFSSWVLIFWILVMKNWLKESARSWSEPGGMGLSGLVPVRDFTKLNNFLLSPLASWMAPDRIFLFSDLIKLKYVHFDSLYTFQVWSPGWLLQSLSCFLTWHFILLISTLNQICGFHGVTLKVLRGAWTSSKIPITWCQWLCLV